jgi:putative pyruvate formate lyase activating enzyme
MWRTIRPDANSIWDNKEVKKILERYREILDGKKLAKYLIFKKIPIEIDLKNASESEMWSEHDIINHKLIYDNYLKKFAEEEPLSEEMDNYLDLKIELLRRIMLNCHICERKCGINRLEGKKGHCGIPKYGKIYSVHLHYGEENVLVPSGTIFFTGCSFECCFCQNFDISTNPQGGHQIDPKKLAAYANSIARDEHARNINYVTPLPHTYAIVYSMKYQKINVAQLWNSNHYASLETMKIISDLFDLWLPDFKYGNNECALRLSNAPNYWETITRNHKMIYESNGEIIIRHLVMPGHIECCTKPILKWIAEHIPNVLVNIMGQYRPAHRVLKSSEKYAVINRTPTSKELKIARKYADELGLIWRPVS